MLVLRAAVTAAFIFAAVGTASASPGVEGTRNLGLSGGRASAFGTASALANPSNMGFQQQFAIEPLYQLHLPSRTHGVGVAIVDSLNNPRFAIGLGYLFLKGTPTIKFDTNTMGERELELSRFGHEAFAAINISLIRNWLGVGLKPKYQYASLRYRDDEGMARNAMRRLNAFGLDTSVTLNILGLVGISAIVNNVTGNHPPAFTADRTVRLDGVDELDNPTVDHDTLPALSEYPLTFEHALAVFPLRRADFSLNFDGVYDFTTYSTLDHVRLLYGGSAEYVLGPVPIRFGTLWDGRGPEEGDERFYISGGVGFVKPAKVGGAGIDAGFSFRQQVTGPMKETFLGFNLGIRLHPDL